MRFQFWIENAPRREEKKSWVEYPPEDAPPPKPLPARAPGSEKEKEKVMDDILNDPNSVEGSLNITAGEGLGAGMFQRKKAKPGDQGVWMHTFEPKRQIINILGKNACKLGAVLLRAFGRPVNNSDDLQESEVHATSGTYRATFVFYDDTDLSGESIGPSLAKGKSIHVEETGKPILSIFILFRILIQMLKRVRRLGTRRDITRQKVARKSPRQRRRQRGRQRGQDWRSKIFRILLVVMMMALTLTLTLMMIGMILGVVLP